MKLIIIMLTLLLAIALTGVEDLPEIESFVFDDIEDEFRLLRYFLTENQRQYAQSLQDSLLINYINLFWDVNDPNPISEDNEFQELVRERVEHANRYYSHFTPGWKTDRGRIYIKYGKPYNIVKQTTGFGSRYTQKDYEIWQYRITGYMTFIFFDMQGHGDYRLIHSVNDDSETSYPQWRSYLGREFDEHLLR